MNDEAESGTHLEGAPNSGRSQTCNASELQSTITNAGAALGGKDELADELHTRSSQDRTCSWKSISEGARCGSIKSIYSHQLSQKSV